MQPDQDFQPPLRWWSQAWRYVVSIAIGAVVWAPVAEAQAEQRPLLFWVDLALGVLVFVLVGWRRRWPMAVAVLAVLATPLSSLAAGAATLATVSVATHRNRWQVIGIGALSMVCTWFYYLLQPLDNTEPWWLDTIVTLLVVTGTLAWGMFIGSRRELVWTLRQRAEAAEAERDLRANQARSNERSRIAREMHDVLAHRISQISLHAGALTFREDLSADEMRSSLAVIQAKAHEALDDLRDVLGVLRADDGQPLTGPQPTYCDLPALIQDARATGTTIDFDERLPAAPPLPDVIGRTLFRIVQEGITNAAKHAPRSTVQVVIDGAPEDGITVVLRNALGFGPTRTPGAGLGLVGLTERAELAGGTLTHGVEEADRSGSRAFVLHAWLPWSSTESSQPGHSGPTEPHKGALS